jgi:hypothetical protein
MDLAKRKYNRSFMNEQLKTILGTPGHPLKFLVDPVTDNWRSRQKYSFLPTVQAGHLTSLHSLSPGAAERLALEDSTFNQWSNDRGESQGGIFLKDAVIIQGVFVELRTALQWANAGFLTPEVVGNALFSSGWRPSK